MQRILLVDDKKENLVAIESLLERDNLEILKAEDGNTALKYLLKYNDIALILLDVQMPGMSGFEAAELMRKNKKTQNLPIFFLTASNDKSYQFKGYEVGAVDFLTKPIQKDFLLSKVKVFLEIDQQKRMLEAQIQEISELKKQNDLLLNALGDALIAVDSAGIISYANPSLKFLFGIDDKSVVKKNIADILFDNPHQEPLDWNASEIYNRTSVFERIQSKQGYFIKSDELIVPVQISAASIKENDTFCGSVITLSILSSNKTEITELLARKNRKQQRKKMTLTLRLFDRNTGVNLGRLINISLDGFKLASKSELPVGSRHAISMVLPDQIAGSNTLSFDAQTIWSRQEDADDEFNHGFRILKISENDLRVLIALIEKY